MSYVMTGLRHYTEKYSLSSADHQKILMHAPLMKACQLALWDPGIKGKMANSLLNSLDDYRLMHTVTDKGGKKHRVALPFRKYDFMSYTQILWADEYGAEFDFSDARTVIDLGTNLGNATLFFLLNCPKLEKVRMIEANPYLLPQIKRTLADFWDGPVDLVLENACASAQSGQEVTFFISPNHNNSTSNSNQGEEGAEKVTVKTRGLRDLLDSNNIEDADILKCDIEWSEYDLMQQDPEVLRRFKYLFFEVHGPIEKRDAFANDVTAQGFRITERIGGPELPAEVLKAIRN